MVKTLARTVQVGLIGSGIQASLSPALHMREAHALGLDYDYALIDLSARGLGVDALPDLLAEAERAGFAGLNITHPAKQAVIPHLHCLAEEAAAIGAVNTVVLRGGRRTGHNTDASGFAESFRRGLPGAALGVVLQLGAGGAGAAVAHALLALGARRLALFDLDPARAEDLALRLAARFADRRIEAVRDTAAAGAADGIVNTTPVGMAKYPGAPLPPELIEPRHWVAEIVYFPLETELLRIARARGCRTLDGGGMAVMQAVGAFRLFTGREPDPERMLRHFEALTRR